MTARRKALLVESDREFSASLAELLLLHEFETLFAVTGEEAIRMALSHCPDLILIETDLPDMDGLKVIQSVREWSCRPMIVVSHRAEAKELADALDVGADDYMVKPYRPTELMARIRAAFRHTRTGSSDLKFANEGKIVVGRLTIDYNKYRVYLDKEDAGLTLNEFRMVALLAQYAGKVLTYEQIIHELWGPNADGDDNQVLRVNMANIRRKIEDDALNPKYLFTESGIGYRMVTQEEAAQWDLTE